MLHTVSSRFVFELINEATEQISEQVEEICLVDSGGPGLGSVRQSFLAKLRADVLDVFARRVEVD